MKLNDYTGFIGWDAAGYKLVEAFLMNETPYESTFHWRKQSDGLLLSPFPERIYPFSESDYEITYPDSGIKYNGLIEIEEKKWVLLSLRQKHGMYPNLHPSGFLNNYQLHPSEKLLIPNWFQPSLVRFNQALNSLYLAYSQQVPAMQQFAKAVTKMAGTLSVQGKIVAQINSIQFMNEPPEPLPHGKLDQPVIGYRCFNVVERGDKVAIASLTDTLYPWLSKTRTTAKCSRRKHKAPDEFCTCGIHAFSTVMGAINYCGFGNVVASILASGYTIQHDDEGFRTEHARILGFLDPLIVRNNKSWYIGATDGYVNMLRDPSVVDKLSEKYQAPIYPSIEAMEMAAKEYGSTLPTGETNE